MRRALAWIVFLGLFLVMALAAVKPAHAQLPQTQCISTAVAGGTTDALTIPLLPCTETTTLLVLTFTAANATMTPTLSVNGQTPHTIVQFDGSAPAAGTFQPSQKRLLTYNGTNWFVLSGTAAAAICALATSGSAGCVQPDGTTISVNGSGVISVIDKPYDIDMFQQGVPANSAVIRSAFTRQVTCPINLTASVGNAKTAATSTTVISLNRVVAGVATLLGTATFSASGTTAAFAFSSAVTFNAGDDIEFAFPATADASLANIAITLKCSRV